MALQHKHQRSEDEQHPQSSLPTEIIVEILLKLPTVNSLLRCKSVCKSWRSLISDPHFIKSHLAISTSNNNHYAHHRLVFSTGWSTMLKSCPLYDLLYDSSAANALNYIDDFPFKHHRDAVWVVGSCQGLVCIAVEGYALYIWNPSTKKSNRLPPSDYKKKHGYVRYGFGYQQSTDDYKVVELFRDFDDKCETFIKIYSLKTGSWKTIGVFPHRFSFTCRANFSNGALHWPAEKASESWAIISLDLANETYGEVLQPVYDEGDKDLRLGSLNEWLCVLCDYRGTHTDFWVMKVYGVKESWAKLISIPYLTDPGRDRFFMPLCMSNDGNILIQYGRKLIVYDSKNGSFSKIQNSDRYLEACTFVESLVSPMPAAGLGDI